MMLHRFTTSITDIPLPERFTYPFCYTPHPLCILAAKEVQSYLTRQTAWKDELRQGKMFGVLIVQTEHGETGYLAAFSGILAGKNLHPFFVPPVYNLLQPQGFFKIEEENISSINRNIRQLENDKAYAALSAELARTIQSAENILATAKAQLKEAKTAREQRRKEKELNAQEEAELIRESQFQKAEYKRLERSWKARITTLQTQTEDWERRISALKSERKTRSAALQQKLFEQFGMLNYRGEVKNLCEIFGQTVHKTPPAGAGECAAPKLLQYAFEHRLTPLAIAEFWWGASPKGEIRRHGHYYPACRGKCGPILAHMLRGLDVEPEPDRACPQSAPELLYEDRWIAAVFKPAGMLSVPGKSEAPSILDWARERYPAATGPLVVHRLDMDTSGVLLLALTKEAHQDLQAQFKHRTVRKRYIALLEGRITPPKGRIELPLRPDLHDRPRQAVDPLHGKPAITEYEVLEFRNGRTRIAFYPLTGRTHQLRVHAAHPSGLNAPIAGDRLYGTAGRRLLLHAERIEFRHPATGDRIAIEKPADF